MSSDIINCISKIIRSSSSDVKVSIWVAVLIAIFNTIHVAYLAGYEDAERIFSQTYLGGGFGRGLRNRIAILLIISCVGLLSRTLIGFALSALSLIYAAKECTSWYYHTAVNVKPYYPDWDVGVLAGGTWWDVTVMLVALALLAWQVFTVASSVRRCRV